ncbi:hypothetical protein ACFVIM_14450 [Streptomyces sp. NPDC057638]|uniref:hypothetical protein n=1 Tax=Streptomyces sp. NPDC057638 TaxID=3346190 RepID=UPI0036842B9A
MSESETERTGGFEVPPLRRLRYFHGQMLGARDFQREQDYLREKLKLRLRGLLGYGVVCGLWVAPGPRHDDCDDGADSAAGTDGTDVADAASVTAADPSDPSDPSDLSDGAGAESAEEPRPDHSGGGDDDPERSRRRPTVVIAPGLAVDCDGNEVVVRDRRVVDLWKALPPEERDTDTVWVGIEYAERPVEPTRAVYNDGCADASDCEYGWTEECYTVRVTGCEPPEDRRCDSRCSRCHHRVLWLARIDDVRWTRPLRPGQIHMNIRRPFGPYVPTVITGISWIHGHTYTIDEAKQVLGTTPGDGGFTVRFSDDVRVDTLLPGVVELQVIEGGAGRNAGTWYMGGEFTEPDPAGGGEGGAGAAGATEDDGHEFTRHLRYRQNTRETLQDGDRVLITVRTAFLLDRCCRPVDGAHVGGRVPLIEDCGHPETAEAAARTRGGCDLPPSRVGPWTSGSGAGGDVFESWFFVKER